MSQEQVSGQREWRRLPLGEFCERHGLRRVDGVLIYRLWDLIGNCADGDVSDDELPNVLRYLAKRQSDIWRAQVDAEARLLTLWAKVSGAQLPSEVARAAVMTFIEGDVPIAQAIAAAYEERASRVEVESMKRESILQARVNTMRESLDEAWDAVPEEVGERVAAMEREIAELRRSNQPQ